MPKATPEYGNRQAIESKDMAMAWTTPILIEICVGLEINGYLPAEF
jgi:coenzyme PQQ precursor peptide PqqA